MPGVIPIRPARPRRPEPHEIDEFGRLQQELKPKNARLESLRDVLKAYYFRHQAGGSAPLPKRGTTTACKFQRAAWSA